MEPASRQLDLDLACVECGYNLRGLELDGRCPECGAAVLASFADRIDQWSEGTYRRIDTALRWIGGTNLRLMIAIVIFVGVALLLPLVISIVSAELMPFQPMYGAVAVLVAMIPLVTIWPWRRYRACAALRAHPGRPARRLDWWRGPVFGAVSNLVIPIGLALQIGLDGFNPPAGAADLALLISLPIIVLVVAWLVHLHWLRGECRELLARCTRIQGMERTFVVAGLRGLDRGMTLLVVVLVIVDLGFCFTIPLVGLGNGRPALWLIAMPIAQLSHGSFAYELLAFMRLERAIATEPSASPLKQDGAPV